jgi:acetyl esterase
LLFWTGGLALLVIAAYAALEVSPWPAALAVRYGFDLGARRTAQALAEHVPSGVAAQLDRQYGTAGDSDTLLDVFYPAALTDGQVLPTVLWVHGGGFISGSKEQVGEYARILAAGGYTVAAVNYSVAPTHTYPLPVRQMHQALGYLAAHAAALHVDAQRFVLAGESAGAQIAAQVANTITSARYAQQVGVTPEIRPTQLAGLILYCGPYEMGRLRGTLGYGLFARAMLWAYSGRRDFGADRAFAMAALRPYLTGRFPPSFISVGNADPLAAQSYALAAALASRGVRVDTLFFAADHVPPLAHEYQFDLDSAEGRLALERSLSFLTTLTMRDQPSLPPRG